MTSLEIRIHLMKSHQTVTGIASELGVHRTFVSQVIAGRRSTTYIQQAIASAIGCSHTDVFPVDLPESETRLAMANGR